MLSVIVRYGPTLAVLGAVVAACVWVAGLRSENADLRRQNDELQKELAGCEARSRNILEDKESDDAIDRIPDFDLRHVPDHWLRKEAPS